ncbi:MAG: TIGR01212 family radical SAM protein [Chlorobi bacterium]|nr:TIGR01212 family radical SAM protein [Chlorobiota bacterium]
MNQQKRYNDYSSYIKRVFGERVQKVSIDAGFTCPNRDGTKGRGGCHFCNNSTFNPDYCGPETSITAQIDKGISFFKGKYKTQKYLAYFQAYTNTYGQTEELMKMYSEALAHPEVTGIVLGTRPDCLEDDLLDELAKINKEKYVAVELGAESTNNDTLNAINRGHSWEDTVDAVYRVKKRGIPVGMHFILGLPGETRNDLLKHAINVSELPVDFIKTHQLQIVKGSRFGWEYGKNPEKFKLFSAEEFIELVVDFLELLSPGIIVERFISQAPPDLLIAPRWGLKNFEFVAKVEKRLLERDTWQGKLTPSYGGTRKLL